MKTAVTLQKHGPVGLVSIDNPPVNALSRRVADGIADAVEQAARDSSIRSLVVHCAGRTFVAGGDIAEFSDPGFGVAGYHRALDTIEAFDGPVVAALHGTAYGGGLELALACHYRLATRSTRVGLPEVRLGLLPGAGGTQRLPRLAGVPAALEMMTTGAPVSADDALRLGILDEIVDGDPLEAAISCARRLLASGVRPARTSARGIRRDEACDGALEQRWREAEGKLRAYPAPGRIARCVEAALTLPFSEGIAVESRLFDECRTSPESVAMRHLFFAEREASKIPGLPPTPVREVKRVGVVGAGTMGGGIAMCFANAGLPVTVVEVSPEALDRGLAVVRRNYEVSVAKGKLTASQAEQRMALLRRSLRYEDLGECDLVVEAVFEDLDLKRKVARRLGEACRPGAIIASNTSTLDVNVLAQETGRPGDFLGTHFFSPANVMRLLEVVRGDRTAPDALVTVVKLAKAIGKVPVVSGVCWGFIGNRMVESYHREAEFLMLEGVPPERIDRAIQALGLPMGPCRMLDMAGIDVGAKVVLEQKKIGALPPDPSYRVVVQRMFELGRFGQKTGSGYYRYEGRTAIPDPEVMEICATLAGRHGIPRRTDVADEEIVERCLYPLINEGARILEEGISYRPGDIDVVWTTGFGFPDFRGGPMHLADSVGIHVIAARMDHYARTRGDPYGYWTKAPLLARLAASGERFADWEAARSAPVPRSARGGRA